MKSLFDSHRIHLAIWICSDQIKSDGNPKYDYCINQLKRNNIPSIAIIDPTINYNDDVKKTFLEIYNTNEITIDELSKKWLLDPSEIIIISDNETNTTVTPVIINNVYNPIKKRRKIELKEITEYNRLIAENDYEGCINILIEIYRKYRFTWALCDLINYLSKSTNINYRKNAFELALNNYNISADISYKLARMYIMAIGTEKSEEKYLEMLEKSTDQGSDSAKYEWIKYILKNHISDKYPKVIELCQNADPRSKAYLAKIYTHGLGVNKNLDKAIELYREAYSKNLGWAANDLSDALVERNAEGDLKESYNILSERIKVGDAWSMIRLARMYRNGIYVEKNIDKAYQLYKNASAAGIPKSANESKDMISEEIKIQIGIDIQDNPQKVLDYVENLRKEESPLVPILEKYLTMYTETDVSGEAFINVEKTKLHSDSLDTRNSAIASLKISTTKGSKKAATILAEHYLENNETDLAIIYLKLSINSETGHYVNKLIDLLLKRGRIEDKYDAYILAYHATEKGDAWSEWRLAKMYLDGIYVTADKDKGIAHLKNSAAHGVTPAINKLESMNLRQ